MLIYVHGFNSGSKSSKAGQLYAYLAGMGKQDAFLCPDLPHRPAQAIALLSDIIQKQARVGDIVKLAGSSLGGFYATWLAEQFGLSAILINPAVHANSYWQLSWVSKKITAVAKFINLPSSISMNWQRWICRSFATRKNCC